MVVTWYKVETIRVRLKKATAVKVKQTLLAPVRVTACMHMLRKKCCSTPEIPLLLYIFI